MAKIHSASAFFNLPGLGDKSESWLTVSLRRHRSSALHILESMLEEGCDMSCALKTKLIQKITKRASGDAVAGWCPRLLEEILRHENHARAESDLFLWLKKWAAGGDGSDHEGGRFDTVKDFYRATSAWT